MGFNPNGNLVEARQNPLVYTIIIGVLVAFVVLIAVGLILKKIRETSSGNRNSDAKKYKPTTNANIEAVSLLANLDAEEKKLLKIICKKFKPRNIEFLIKEIDEIKSLFKQQYDSMLVEKADPKQIETFFTLFYKFEKTYDSVSMIKTVKAIPVGQKLVYEDSNKKTWTMTLDRHEPQNLVITIPKMLYENENKPSALSKCTLSFKTEAGTQYSLVTRIVRYEEEKLGKYVMFASVNATLSSSQHRATKRRHIEKDIVFYAVKTELTANGLSFAVQEKEHTARLENISTGGCRLICPVPIKKDQYLCIKLELNGRTIKAIGIIVNTVKVTDDSYELHIKFEKIDTKVKNTISAFIYDYVDSNA